MIQILQKYKLFSNEILLSCKELPQQGYCNKNYLLQTDKQKYIVRKNLVNEIDREAEFFMYTLAYKHGITSEPLYWDKTMQITISTFLEGEHIVDLENNQILNIAKLLQILHHIDLAQAPIVLEKLLSPNNYEERSILEKIDTFKSEYVFCHNDLNPQNILFNSVSNSVKLIDWEYAGVNDRYFDLACVCVEFDLSLAQEKMFLTQYFSSDSSFDADKLKIYKILYIAVKKRWFLNYSKPSH